MHRLILATAFLACVFQCPTSASAEVTAEQVNEAIDKAVGFLERQQHADGTWDDLGGWEGGATALVTLALLNAGVEPESAVIKKALAALRDVPRRQTYVVALRVMAFTAARSKRDFDLIRQDTRYLQDSMTPSGMWGYSINPGSKDNSNTQFALLGLHEAERFDPAIAREIKDETWAAALNHWRTSQNPDGSWGYDRGPLQRGTGSMTAAGIASLVICSGKTTDGLDDRKLHCCGEVKPDRGVENGLAWLGRNWSVQRNPNREGGAHNLYYLYALERAGRLSARRFIPSPNPGEKIDWYRAAAQYLVSDQNPLSGSWKGSDAVERNADIATAYCLLVLSKGRRPILMSKIHYGKTGDWNHHPEDVRNLTTYIEKSWEKDLSWQIVDIDRATVDDLMQSPVLFLSGQQRPLPADLDPAKLREYINQGGFIFAEACCDTSLGFDQGFRDLMKRMFSEDEGYSLLPLPPDHPLWRMVQLPPDYVSKMTGHVYGVNVSCRTSIVFVDRDLSCRWQHASPRRMTKLRAEDRIDVNLACALGDAVLSYATDRKVRFKDLDDRKIADRDGQKLPRGALRIALVEHSGGGDVAPQALPNLRRALRKVKGVRVDFEDTNKLPLSDKGVFDFPVLLMHGRHAFSLTEADRKNLVQYVQRGGVLICDAVCGNQDFVDSFRREMQKAFPDNKMERLPADHDLFTTRFGGADVRTVKRREPVRAAPDKPLTTVERSVEPHLEGIKIGPRYGVLFSPYDISCALENRASPECRGYVAEDALKLGVNAVLYSLYQPGP